MGTGPLLRRATVERIEQPIADTRVLFLREIAPPGLNFVPGQFVSLQLPSGDPERPLVRPYSIASDPGDPLLQIALNSVPGGAGSSYLFARRVGDELCFTGPWGTFTADRAPEAECVFIAEGTGLAPMRPMIRRFVVQPAGSLHLLSAVPSADRMLFRADFEALVGTRFGFETVPEGVGEDAATHLPLLDLVRRRYVEADGDRSRHFWICGVGDIVTRLRDLLRAAGYDRRAVKYEKW